MFFCEIFQAANRLKIFYNVKNIYKCEEIKNLAHLYPSKMSGRNGEIRAGITVKRICITSTAVIIVTISFSDCKKKKMVLVYEVVLNL